MQNNCTSKVSNNYTVCQSDLVFNQVSWEKSHMQYLYNYIKQTIKRVQTKIYMTISIMTILTCCDIAD